MKSIQTLVRDIYNFVESHEELDIPLTIRFGERKGPPTLRLSKMGSLCPRHLWHSIHTPELAEPIEATALIKFAYGNEVEALGLALAKASGHEVTGEQDELSVLGVKGHRDCVLDGHICDVKSCSGRMFEKFQTKAIHQDDPFGYLDQLDGYMVGSVDDDLVRVKDRAYIFAIDKVFGRMCTYEHRLRADHIKARIEHHKRIVQLPRPPDCECGVVPDGKSGNYRLDTKASYSPFKFVCFPGLRVFLYSDGYRYLTKVNRLPNVPELTREGKLVYN